VNPEPYSLVGVIPTKFFIDRNGVIKSISFGSGGFAALERAGSWRRLFRRSPVRAERAIR
jgi:hypothetical protein